MNIGLTHINLYYGEKLCNSSLITGFLRTMCGVLNIETPTTNMQIANCNRACLPSFLRQVWLE